jgi:hypothetical protein
MSRIAPFRLVHFVAVQHENPFRERFSARLAAFPYARKAPTVQMRSVGSGFS